MHLDNHQLSSVLSINAGVFVSIACLHLFPKVSTQVYLSVPPFGCGLLGRLRTPESDRTVDQEY